MGASKRLRSWLFRPLLNECVNLLFHGSFWQCLGLFRIGSAVIRQADRTLVDQSPLTHPDIVRYFMTIPEAAQLVLQAAGLATGGEVFVLDMGEPVRIYDLAQQMVTLSGLQLKDDANPDGDIEIICTGLRPGEKLFEELLIDADVQPTEHPLILLRARSLLAC